ncbi:hypothetical protein [Ornithinimicrobium cerasi]|uniref:hypothetical protein n=1 Tax=Ornithinimicrobium cerasi TaxID=2248773 RepID=UPI000EFFD2F3|nr:hypothetical protein [Ornithinimicrobium cerasi]
MTFPEGTTRGPDLPPPGPPAPFPPPGAPGPPGPPAAGTTWHHLAPEQLARLHQPGVVPLRPLTLGDMFGGALQTMRRNPSATIGTALVVLALLLVPSYLGSLAITRFADLAEEDLAVLVPLVNLLFSGLASIALTGMIVYVVSEAVLGDRVGLRQTWEAVRGRIPALLGALLLIALLFLLATAALVAGVAGIVLAMDGAGDGAVVGLVVLLLALLLASVVLLLWGSARVSLTTAAVVLERAGPWRALRRSWTLTRGWQAWRVLGITLLAGLVTGLFATMVQLPVTTVTFLALDGLSGGLSPVHPVVLLTDHLVQVVVQAFSIPFSAGVTALLYLDLRIRREGLDVGLVRAAQARAVGRAR